MIKAIRRVRARRANGDRGAVAVEAALVTFPVLALIFGGIDFSLLLRDNIAMTSLVRTGARIASAEARFGSTAACSSATSRDDCFAQDAADAIQRAGSALPKDSIQYIDVFQAGDDGEPTSGCPGSKCYRYTWNDNTNRFQYAGGAWDPQSINACFGDEGETVGVRMQILHKAAIGLFFQTFTMQDTAVMKFEPKSNATCRPGA